MTLRLVVRGLAKAFGGTRALAGVDLEATAGEIHAVLGENGAGKSTLMGILGGALRADAGSVTLDGAHYAPASPIAAHHAGIAIVHQELSICPHLTVAENVVLGREPVRFGLVDRREARAITERALALVLGPGPARFGPDDRAGALSVAEQQLVEIARALSVPGTRVLVLDEPTSSLARADVDRLFERIRELAASGLTVLYVSHFLDEVRSLCHRYMVLRDGRTVATGAIEGTTSADLVAAMSGARKAEAVRAARGEPGEVLVTAKGLAGARLPVDATFELRRGEIVGIAGLVGSGRTELLRAIFGLDRVTKGELRVHAPMGMASEDRKREGLALGLSVADNVILGRMPWLVTAGRARALAEPRLRELAVKGTPDQRAIELSGGNQQKVALARLLHQEVDVLLLDEPTRGVDVASKAEILELLDRLAGAGKAILVVSSQLDELAGACDRVHVMRRGVLGPSRPAGERTARELFEEASSS